MYSDVLTDHPAIGRPVTELPTPAPVVDVDLLQGNIARMAAFFQDRPARLRPHAKTHRAPAVARMQVAAGAPGVTCAKVAMDDAGNVAELADAAQAHGVTLNVVVEVDAGMGR